MDEKFVDSFDTIESQIEGMYSEIGILSKKKPDGPINKFKIGFINKLVSQANSLLGKEYKPFDDFERFDEDELPTASDVVLILSQYLKAMNKFRFDNTKIKYGTCYWVLDDFDQDEDGYLWKETKPSTFA